ncbi:hypothetical protein ACWD25_54105, partial [Streptomyces sp. NPDC002920]
MSPSTPPDERPLRADARQNVEQILQVAQDVFADLADDPAVHTPDLAFDRRERAKDIGLVLALLTAG